MPAKSRKEAKEGLRETRVAREKKAREEAEAAAKSEQKLYILTAPPAEANSHEWVAFEGVTLDDIQFSVRNAGEPVKSEDGRVLVNPNALFIASEVSPQASF